MSLLEVHDLHVSIGPTEILRGVALRVDAGETVGVVGESGCGKSMTGLALMGMLPAGGRISRGTISLAGRDMTHLTDKQWNEVRGQEIALVMQDPFTSLNPLMRVGDQIAEVFTLHKGLTKQQARKEAVDMLRKVGVPSPEDSARKYPHQMSGGQRQRVVIAIAFAARPKILIADEPTTALDVTLQAQILRLLKELQREEKTGVILISHDIGVIASVADQVSVYYAGRVVEHGVVSDVLTRPRHPYTEALMAAMPSTGQDRLTVISGQPPLLQDLPPGCAFAPRCPYRFEPCGEEPGLMSTDTNSQAACWKVDQSRVIAGTDPNEWV